MTSLSLSGTLRLGLRVPWVLSSRPSESYEVGMSCQQGLVLSAASLRLLKSWIWASFAGQV